MGTGQVIRLTRLNGKGFILNADLIKVLEETPDTVVTLVNGERMVVTEKADEVVALAVEYGRLLRAFRLE